MQYNLHKLTADDMARLAQRDDVTVMTEVHDRVYDPWPLARVSACVHRLIAFTAAASPDETVDAIRARAIADDEEFGEFSRTHQLWFERMTTPTFVADPRAIVATKALLATRARMEEGHITEQQAREHAAGVALRHAVEESRARPTEERDDGAG